MTWKPAYSDSSDMHPIGCIGLPSECIENLYVTVFRVLLTNNRTHVPKVPEVLSRAFLYLISIH